MHVIARTTAVLAAAFAVGAAGAALAVPAIAAASGAEADTPANVLVPAVHTDIATTLDEGGGLRLLFHTEDGAYLDPATTIVEVPETTRRGIPAPSGGRDFTFMGPVGSDVWLLPATQTDGVVWLGWSAESKHIPDSAYRGQLDLRLDGVSGADGGAAPGELVLSDDFTSMGNTPMFSTREGLPHAVQLARGTHKHLNWAFTAPGTYCVGFALGGELADDTYSESPSVMTFVVGRPPGLDPTAITTCAQAAVDPTGRPAREPTDAPAGQVKIFHPRPLSGSGPGTNEYATLRPILTGDGQLDIALVEGTQVDAGVRYDPDNATYVIDRTSKRYAENPADNYYGFGSNQAQGFYGRTQLHFDTTRLDGIDGDVLTWRLDDVRAPGHFSLTARLGGAGAQPVLGNRPGESADTWTTRARRGGELSAKLFQAGIYCVDLTWSATPTGAAPTSVTKTLRFAVDVENPERATDEDCGKTPAEYDVGTATTLTAAPVAQVYGQPAPLVVTVAPSATGTVTAVAGSHTLAAALDAGEGTLTIPARALEPGAHSLTVAYAGVAGVFEPSTGAADVTVAKATPTVKVTAPTKVRRGKTAKVAVTVTAPGAKPGGKVTVKLAGVRPKTVRVNANGKAVARIKVPAKATPGPRKVVVTYRGDAFVAKAKASTKVRVVR